LLEHKYCTMETMLKTHQGIAWSVLTPIEGLQAVVEQSTICSSGSRALLSKTGVD